MCRDPGQLNANFYNDLANANTAFFYGDVAVFTMCLLALLALLAVGWRAVGLVRAVGGYGGRIFRPRVQRTHASSEHPNIATSAHGKARRA
jgi:hypothetical protein